MKSLITTERLVIRPIEIGDCEAVHRYAGDPSIDMMMFLPNETIEETKKFVEFAVSEWAKEEPEDMEFVILLDGEIIGGVNLEKCEAERTYEIGWTIRKDQRGKGYATEAAKALKDYAFEVLNAEVVQAHCDSRNQASEKVMKKLGMTLVDDTGTRYYPKTGVSSGEYLYAINRRAIMSEIKRIEVDEFWADSTIIEAGDQVYVGYCMANEGKSIEEQMHGAIDVLESRLMKVGLTLESVVKMDCLFKDINDLNALPAVLKERFNGKYPTRKAYTSDFIREGIRFQIDAIAYKPKE